MLLKKWWLKAVLLIWAVICVTMLPSCSADAVDATEISSVTVEKGGQSVKVTAVFLEDFLEAYKGEKVYLIAQDLPKSGSLSDGFEVLGEAKVKEKVSFTFSLTDGMMRSRLTKAFSIAVKEGESYSTVTPAAYIENPEALATGGDKPNKALSLKGLSGNAVVGAEVLGAEHVLLEADMDKLILTGYKDNSISFVSEGVTYYFDSDEVDKLDAAVKEANLLGMRVYMRTSLRYPEPNEDGEYEKEPIDVLYCKGASKGSNGYMPNLANETTIGYLKAFYSFLGARYAYAPDSVADFIIGENVNDYESYCDMALRGEEELLSYYSAWARLANNVLKAQNKSASVYVSVDNGWRAEEGSKVIGSKFFLAQFAEAAKLSGDYGWKIAMSMNDPRDVTSVMVGDSVDYSRINAESFSELFDFVKSSSMIYGSLQRDVIIDSVSVPQSIADANRAAYYAYTYYTAAEAGVKAMIYSCSDGCGLENAGGERGELYYCMLLCGTNTYSQLADYVKLIEYATVPDMGAYATRELTYEQSVAGEVGGSALKNSKELVDSLDKFSMIGDTYDKNISIKTDVDGTQYHVMSVYTEPHQGAGGVACFDVPAADIVGSGYLGLRLSSNYDEKITVVISSKSAGGYASYIGEVTVGRDAKDHYFNITPFTENVEAGGSVSVLIISQSRMKTDGESFVIEDVSLYGSSGNGANTVIIVIAVAASILGVCGLLFWLSGRRKRKISSHNED